MYEEVMHYGVRGMRWGHRKAGKKGATQDKVAKKVADKKMSELKKNPPPPAHVSKTSTGRKLAELTVGVALISLSIASHRKMAKALASSESEARLQKATVNALAKGWEAERRLSGRG